MKLPTPELLLALRSPTSGWLAAVIVALDEALRDPDFSEHQRDLLRGLLDAGSVPAQVAEAAEDRLHVFEEAVQNMHGLLTNSGLFPSEPVAQRPNLSLCGTAAA